MIDVETYGAVGDGTTLVGSAVNAAIVDNPGEKLYFKPGDYLIDAVNAGIKLNRANTSLVLSPGATIRVATNNSPAYMAIEVSAPDCSIDGGTVKGDVSTHTGTTGEWGHLIVAQADADRLSIVRTTVAEAWGDGIAIQGGPEDVSVIYVTANKNRRQGLSIIEVVRPTVVGGSYINTGFIKSIAPTAGIDIEPNANGFVHDALIFGVHCAYNKGPNLQIASDTGSECRVGVYSAMLTGSTTQSGLYITGPAGTIDATLSDVIADSNYLHGFVVTTPGVKMNSLTSRYNGWYGFQINSSKNILDSFTSENNMKVGFQVSGPAAIDNIFRNGLVIRNSRLVDGGYNNIDNFGTGTRFENVVSEGSDDGIRPANGWSMRPGSSAKLIDCDARGTFKALAWSDSSSGGTLARPVPGVPIGVLPAAAVDAMSTQTLVNAIRAELIKLGLVK